MEKPTARIVTGLIGAGKSHYIRATQTNEVLVSSDLIREQLVGYQYRLDESGSNRAEYMQFRPLIRQTMLSLIERLTEERRGIIYETTFKPTPENWQIMDTLRRQGYDMRIEMLTTTPEVARARAEQRFLKGGLYRVADQQLAEVERDFGYAVRQLSGVPVILINN